MFIRDKNPGKNSADSSSTPVQSGLFRSRPFFDPKVSDKVSTHQQELPNLQTQLERGDRFNQSLTRMKVYGDKPVIQPKLTVGAPGDKYEPVADRMAQQVMSMPAAITHPPIQRLEKPEEEHEEVMTKPLAASITPLVQRETAPAELEENLEEDQEQLQMKPLQRDMYEQGAKRVVDVVQKMPDTVIQRTPNTDKLRQLLDDDDENDAIEQMKSLSSAEKQLVLESREFKELAIDSFWNEEMYRAMKAMCGDLYQSLQWMFDEGANNWDWVRDLILHAPSGKERVRTDNWMRDQFVDMCDDEEMITAVRLLGSTPTEKADWLAAEGVDSEPLYESVVAPLSMPNDASNVFDVLMKLPRKYRDDIAYHFIKNISDDTITQLASNGSGRRLLVLILAEIADGWSTGEEKEQRDRMMPLVGADGPDLEQADREADANNRAKEGRATEATQLIEKHTSWGNLDEGALGKELLGLLPGDTILVEQVLDTLGSTNRDDVSFEVVQAADDDQIKAIVSNSSGRLTLMRMVHELYKGDMSDDERAQMQRVMKLISEVDKEQGASVEVEVITYLYGGAVLDAAGVALAGGSKGHTAIAVGDRLYSFEAGWNCGLTKQEYLVSNRRKRDGIGQVLDLPEDDARKVQANLDASCGQGVYIFSGDICTDSTAQALEGVLKNLNSGWNPQRFVGYLEAAVPVKEHRFYPKQSE